MIITTMLITITTTITILRFKRISRWQRSMEQLQQYEMWDTKAVHYHQAKIVEIYGCKVPCNYKVCVSLTDCHNVCIIK